MRKPLTTQNKKPSGGGGGGCNGIRFLALVPTYKDFRSQHSHSCN